MFEKIDYEYDDRYIGYMIFDHENEDFLYENQKEEELIAILTTLNVQGEEI